MTSLKRLSLSSSDVTILNRAQHGDRLKNFDVRIGSDSSNYQNNPTCHDRVGQARDNEAVRVQCKPPLPGRYVRVQMFGRGILTMCEVLVYSRLGEFFKCFENLTAIQSQSHVVRVLSEYSQQFRTDRAIQYK